MAFPHFNVTFYRLGSLAQLFAQRLEILSSCRVICDFTYLQERWTWFRLMDTWFTFDTVRFCTCFLAAEAAGVKMSWSHDQSARARTKRETTRADGRTMLKRAIPFWCSFSFGPTSTFSAVTPKSGVGFGAGLDNFTHLQHIINICLLQFEHIRYVVASLWFSVCAGTKFISYKPKSALCMVIYFMKPRSRTINTKVSKAVKWGGSWVFLNFL